MGWDDPAGSERRPGDPWAPPAGERSAAADPRWSAPPGPAVPPPAAGPPPVAGPPYGAYPAPYQPAPAPYGAYPARSGPQPPPWGPPSRRRLSGGAIALIVVGAVLGLAAILLGVLVAVRGMVDGPVPGPSTYGDDTRLDQLWDRCEAGDGASCDELYRQSPVGSEYEEFGDTCGRRFAPGETFCDGAVGRSRSTV